MAKPYQVCILMANSYRLMSTHEWVAYTHDVFRVAAGAGTIPYHGAAFTEHGEENYCIIVDIPEIEIESLREQLATIRKEANGSRLSLFHNEITYV